MPTLSGRTILVVEDEEVIAYLIEDVLRSAGANVVIAPTLKRALSYVDEDRDIAVAILDYRLPDGNCLPICDRLLKQDIPFVICSAVAAVGGSARSALQLCKPVPLDELVRAVEDLAKGSPNQRRERVQTARQCSPRTSLAI
jgi:DNA-binding response OmpR family regulator